ncbi:MAG: hypothetical protein IMY86_13855 [Chloroflexi bacterium]|nr:hypothetical protein [Chloroflexota bacterium]
MRPFCLILAICLIAQPLTVAAGQDLWHALTIREVLEETDDPPKENDQSSKPELLQSASEARANRKATGWVLAIAGSAIALSTINRKKEECELVTEGYRWTTVCKTEYAPNWWLVIGGGALASLGWSMVFERPKDSGSND